MNLKGTRTEVEFRKELTRTHKAQLGSDSNSRIKEVLLDNGEKPESSYILNWIPEESSDILLIYLTGNRLVSIEIERNNMKLEPVVEYRDFQAYTQGLSKVNRIKLTVAQELSHATA